MLSLFENQKVSEVPCARCGEDVIEFSIPNDIWNRVIRLDGHERDDEYICMECFFQALRAALGLYTRSKG